MRRRPRGRAAASRATSTRRGGPSPAQAGPKARTHADLLQDLQVHQAELELQNEELRRARQALELARDEYLDLYDFAPVGYLRFLETGRVSEINLAGAALLGLDRREILGRAFEGFVAVPDRVRWASHHDEARRGEAPVSCEILLRKADGTMFPVQVTSVRRAAAAGGPALVLTAVLDLTERDRTARELAAATARIVEEDRRKAGFLAVLSHELRNPLAAIRSGLEVLDRAPPGSEPGRRAREALHRQSAHLSRLVDDLLDITRIGRGRIELQVARVEAREAVQRACDDALAAFEQRGVALRCSLPSEPIWVDADAVRLAQMVGNLLHNGLKFTPPGGRVGVSLGCRSGWVEVAVADDGPGIRAQDLQRIFEPFVQAARPTQGRQSGLGIGLALVRELATQHGGLALARSAGPGLGSEFVIRLPAAGAGHQAAAPPVADPGCPPLSILVVEDDEDAGSVLGDLLALEGHTVTRARSGRGAVEASTAARPDVVICDVGLPDMSGYDALRAIRSAAPSVAPFAIALTGFAQPEDRESAREAGFDVHLAKPAMLAELSRALTQAARRKAAMAGPMTPG